MGGKESHPPEHGGNGKGQGARGQNPQKWETPSLWERAEQGRAMAERSRDTDLGVGVAGARLGGG